jgi:hypothetical protein
MDQTFDRESTTRDRHGRHEGACRAKRGVELSDPALQGVGMPDFHQRRAVLACRINPPRTEEAPRTVEDFERVTRQGEMYGTAIPGKPAGNAIHIGISVRG